MKVLKFFLNYLFFAPILCNQGTFGQVYGRDFCLLMRMETFDEYLLCAHEETSDEHFTGLHIHLLQSFEVFNSIFTDKGSG